VIAVESLTHIYPRTRRGPARTALDALSLTVAEGEFAILSGPNGSGKTTLFRILCGVIRPSAGAVRVAGHDLLADAAPAWARLLRRGGACGIAWNTLVARRDAAATILADAGLGPVDTGPYLAFRHRVDQAIVRDILVAVKP